MESGEQACVVSKAILRAIKTLALEYIDAHVQGNVGIPGSLPNP